MSNCWGYDIGFVDGMNLLAAAALGVLEGEAGDARGGALGDNFEAFDHAGDYFVLEAGVQILGIFAHQNDVYIFKARRHAG